MGCIEKRRDYRSNIGSPLFPSTLSHTVFSLRLFLALFLGRRISDKSKQQQQQEEEEAAE